MEWIQRLIVGLAVAGVSACGPVGPPPQPPPTPAPQPSPICEPGATCGCWHQPPGEDWQQLPPCPGPPPQPTPCNPLLDPGLSAPPADSDLWRGPLAGVDSVRRVE